MADIQQFGALTAQGYLQTLFEGVQDDEVAQDVPFKG